MGVTSRGLPAASSRRTDTSTATPIGSRRWRDTPAARQLHAARVVDRLPDRPGLHRAAWVELQQRLDLSGGICLAATARGLAPTSRPAAPATPATRRASARRTATRAAAAARAVATRTAAAAASSAPTRPSRCRGRSLRAWRSRSRRFGGAAGASFAPREAAPSPHDPFAARRRLQTGGRRGGPARVVSIAPSTTEMVFAIGAGDALVGRSRYCDYPPEALKLPVVGGFADPNLEAVLALDPTLVVGARGPAGPALEDALHAHGIDTYFPEPESLAQIEGILIELGWRLDHEAGAKNAVEAIQASAPRSRPRYAGARESAPCSSSTSRRGRRRTRLVRRRASEDRRRRQRDHRGRQVPDNAEERLITIAPEVILDGSVGEHDVGSRVLALRDAPGWKSLAAISGGRVRALSASEESLPRTTDWRGLELMARGARVPRARAGRLEERANARRRAARRAGARRDARRGPGANPRRRVFDGERRVDKAGALLGDNAVDSRSGPNAASSRAAATSSTPRSRSSLRRASSSRARAASTSAPRPAGSPTACSSAAPPSVVAVDVGFGQLAREAPRRPARRGPRAHQRARLAPETSPTPIEVVVVDASFISPRQARGADRAARRGRRGAWSRW